MITPRRIMLLGASGTIGRAVASTLVARGHEVVCLLRRPRGASLPPGLAASLRGAHIRHGDATDAASLRNDGFRGERFDVLVSCLASRTGLPRDAWAIDFQAHMAALEAARRHGVSHIVLLSAICVQKPRLAFQYAKLAFERALIGSGTPYTIVRPTAFFKSLSGQIERVRKGKPFLVFGDGTQTACKPISDDDLAAYIADCLEDPERRGRILPIGGPGPAVTPRMQAEHLFQRLGSRPRIRHVPLALLDTIIGAFDVAGKISLRAARKAELARIGRYYATESMLVLDEATGRYEESATPSTGSDTLFAFYDRVLRGEAGVDLGAHAVF